MQLHLICRLITTVRPSIVFNNETNQFNHWSDTAVTYLMFHQYVIVWHPMLHGLRLLFNVCNKMASKFGNNKTVLCVKISLEIPGF